MAPVTHVRAADPFEGLVGDDEPPPPPQATRVAAMAAVATHLPV